MLIVGLNGSPNTKGNTAYFIDFMLNIVKEQGLDILRIDVDTLLRNVNKPFCTECSSPCRGICYKETELVKAYESISKADGIIMASPVYFGTVSAQLKAFWDKTRNLRFEKKLYNTVGAAVTTGASRFGGQETTVRALHDMMLVQGMIIVGDGYCENDSGHHGVCSVKPSYEDVFAQKRAEITANRIIEVCNATRMIRIK